MTESEKLVQILLPLIISLLGLALGWARWKGGEKNVADSNAVNNFADAASKTVGMNERLQSQIEAHAEEKRILQEKLNEAAERLQKQMDAHADDKSALQKTIEEAASLIAELRLERETLLQEHKNWQDRNIDLAKRVGVLSQNYEGVQKELERIRRWGYANAAEVARLGGTPIRMEDVR